MRKSAPGAAFPGEDKIPRTSDTVALAFDGSQRGPYEVGAILEQFRDLRAACGYPGYFRAGIVRPTRTNHVGYFFTSGFDASSAHAFKDVAYYLLQQREIQLLHADITTGKSRHTNKEYENMKRRLIDNAVAMQRRYNLAPPGQG